MKNRWFVIVCRMQSYEKYHILHAYKGNNVNFYHIMLVG